MGGHRGLIGLICMAKIKFLWRSYMKWGHASLTPSSPPLQSYQHVVIYKLITLKIICTRTKFKMADIWHKCIWLGS